MSSRISCNCPTQTAPKRRTQGGTTAHSDSTSVPTYPRQGNRTIITMQTSSSVVASTLSTSWNAADNLRVYIILLSATDQGSLLPFVTSCLLLATLLQFFNCYFFEMISNPLTIMHTLLRNISVLYLPIFLLKHVAWDSKQYSSSVLNHAGQFMSVNAFISYSGYKATKMTSVFSSHIITVLITVQWGGI